MRSGSPASWCLTAVRVPFPVHPRPPLTCADYLLYGRLFLPTGRLDALYSTRLSPTLQASLSAISDPPALRGTKADMSNVMLNLQHDIGRWCAEYTYSAEDAMVGVRVLHNFGRRGGAEVSGVGGGANAAVKRVDEEDAVEGGLKGRVSVGAEFYFSAKERSAGVSTGIRFTTQPDATPPSFQVPPPSPTAAAPPRNPPLQPPTTITALFNPMLGHISNAYTARVSPDLALSSRFDFNVYSFESEWAMGVEWWLRRPPSSTLVPDTSTSSELAADQPPPTPALLPDVNGVVKARASTNNVGTRVVFSFPSHADFPSARTSRSCGRAVCETCS